MRNRAAGERRFGGHVSGLALAAAWAWTGAVFHLQHFAAINFMAPVYGWVFMGQSLLFAWSGAVRGRLTPRLDGSTVGWAGVALAAYAVVGDPALAVMTGEGLARAEVVGLAPGPTALFTLGLLLLADGRAPLHLAAVPVLWTLIAGATACALGMVEDLTLPLLGLGSLALILWKNRQCR